MNTSADTVTWNTNNNSISQRYFKAECTCDKNQPLLNNVLTHIHNIIRNLFFNATRQRLRRKTECRNKIINFRKVLAYKFNVIGQAFTFKVEKHETAKDSGRKKEEVMLA